MKLVVDASVVVKWFVSESLSENARLLPAHRLELHAPGLLLAEFESVIACRLLPGEPESASRRGFEMGARTA